MPQILNQINDKLFVTKIEVDIDIGFKSLSDFRIYNELLI